MEHLAILHRVQRTGTTQLAHNLRSCFLVVVEIAHRVVAVDDLNNAVKRSIVHKFAQLHRLLVVVLPLHVLLVKLRKGLGGVGQ